MNLHEYQAKELLSHYGVPLPHSEIANNAEEAANIANAMVLPRWVVKAQVHAGGRGKGGGVKIVSTKAALIEAVTAMIGTRLVTYQTTAQGQPIHHVLIEEPCDIARELYLSLVIDRATQRITVITSTEGGMEIEKVAIHSPEKIFKIAIEPFIGIQPYQSRYLSALLQLSKEQANEYSLLLLNLSQCFVEQDVSLLEINPLVVTKQGKLCVLDTKISIDDNALYRQPRLKQLRDASQEDERENQAREWGLNYIALEGNIGCMVNGAGLAMATMDLIKLHGGQPANFLDVGGSATKERVTEAFKIILSDKKIKAILVNIFGGIVRCDLIAEGIISAVAEVGTTLPVVVRLEGNRADSGITKLQASELNIIPATSFDQAAEKVVLAAGRARKGEAD